MPKTYPGQSNLFLFFFSFFIQMKSLGGNKNVTSVDSSTFFEERMIASEEIVSKCFKNFTKDFKENWP